jgi:ABC-type glycerol-3-phosphate transport system permease component
VAVIARPAYASVSRRFPRLRVSSILLFALVAAWALIAVMPVITTFLGSLKSTAQISADPLGLPDRIHLENYVSGWNGVVVGEPMSTYFVNTVMFATVAIIATTLFGSMAAYALARRHGVINRFLQRYFLILFAVPFVATIIPLFAITGDLGMRSNQPAIGLVFAAVLLPQTVILMLGYFAAFPFDLVEAAKVDGASEARAFVSVVVPVAKGGILSVALLGFINAWNDLAYTLVLLVRPETKTIPPGLLLFTQQYSVDIGAQLAGMFIGIIPLIVAYVVLQRYIMEGFRVGAYR